MAGAPGPPRLIPNFAMDKPWTEPTTEEEDTDLASLIFLSGLPGALDKDRIVVAYVQDLSGDNINALSQATA